MKRISWKYLAGFIDGEGCIDFQCYTSRRRKNKVLYIRPRLRVALSDNARFILEMIKANHGGNIYVLRRSHRNPNWQDASYWQIEGKRLRPVLQNVIKHMFIKKEQAKFSLWWINNVMGKEFNDHMRPDGSVLKQFARDEMKAMKVDPQRLSEVAVKKLKAFGYGIWSRYSNQCLNCGTTSEKHEAKGYCGKCYDAIKWQKSKIH